MGQKSATEKFRYYPHIDGLRALAVIGVLIFHINENWLPAGYLGVDIFFVISGFVISQALYKKYLETGKISVGDFYRRRLQRLYPALLAMILLTTLAYIVFGFLWDTNLFFKSAAASILAVSNLYFLFRGEQYFEQDFINPLLHTWSLGVEEQFYLIYPLGLGLLLLALSYLKLSGRALWVGVVILLTSLVIFVWFGLSFGNNIVADFYSPLARFWELGIGCALFFLSLYYRPKRWSNWLWLVSILLLVSLVLTPEFYNNLVKGALLASLATTFMIFAGLSQETALAKLFTNKVSVYIGKLSYSIYLYHLPIIYFVSLYFSNSVLVTLTLTAIFSVLSYHLVEVPARYSTGLSKVLAKIFKQSKKIAAIGLVALVILLLNVDQVKTMTNSTFNGLGEWSKQVNYIETNYRLGERISPDYFFKTGNSSAPCLTDNKAVTHDLESIRHECLQERGFNRLIFLTGDSHAQHLLPALSHADLWADVYFVQFPRKAIINEPNEIVGPEEFTKTLEQLNGRLVDFAKKYERIDLVISFNLTPYEKDMAVIGKKLEEIISQVENEVEITLVAPTPTFDRGPVLVLCVVLNSQCATLLADYLKERSLVMDEFSRISRRFPRISILDLSNELCQDNKCLVYDAEQDILVFRDQDHISQEMSIRLAPFVGQWFGEIITDNI